MTISVWVVTVWSVASCITVCRVRRRMVQHRIPLEIRFSYDMEAAYRVDGQLFLRRHPFYPES